MTTCTSATLFGIAAGMIIAICIISVVLWAAAKISGSHADAETPKD